MVLASFNHRAVEPVGPGFETISGFVLPDGSTLSICVNGDESEGNAGHIVHCDFCVFSHCGLADRPVPTWAQQRATADDTLRIESVPIISAGFFLQSNPVRGPPPAINFAIG